VTVVANAVVANADAAEAKKRPGCIWRVFVWAVLPAMILLVLIPVGLDIVPSWSAEFGYGVHGTFTALVEEHGNWTGDRVNVYPVDRGGDWVFTTFFGALLLAALGFWIVKVPVAARRRAARRRHPERYVVVEEVEL
jgi:hypothetical protein